MIGLFICQIMNEETKKIFERVIDMSYEKAVRFNALLKSLTEIAEELKEYGIQVDVNEDLSDHPFYKASKKND